MTEAERDCMRRENIALTLIELNYNDVAALVSDAKAIDNWIMRGDAPAEPALDDVEPEGLDPASWAERARAATMEDMAQAARDAGRFVFDAARDLDRSALFVRNISSPSMMGARVEPIGKSMPDAAHIEELIRTGATFTSTVAEDGGLLVRHVPREEVGAHVEPEDKGTETATERLIRTGQTTYGPEVLADEPRVMCGHEQRDLGVVKREDILQAVEDVMRSALMYRRLDDPNYESDARVAELFRELTEPVKADPAHGRDEDEDECEDEVECDCSQCIADAAIVALLRDLATMREERDSLRAALDETHNQVVELRRAYDMQGRHLAQLGGRFNAQFPPKPQNWRDTPS